MFRGVVLLFTFAMHLKTIKKLLKNKTMFKRKFRRLHLVAAPVAPVTKNR